MKKLALILLILLVGCSEDSMEIPDVYHFKATVTTHTYVLDAYFSTVKTNERWSEKVVYDKGGLTWKAVEKLRKEYPNEIKTVDKPYGINTGKIERTKTITRHEYWSTN